MLNSNVRLLLLLNWQTTAGILLLLESKLLLLQ